MRWKQYVEQVAKIRILSSPEVNTSMSATEYYDVMINNFTTIRELAGVNHQILEEDIYPFLNHTDELLPEEIVEEFCQMSEELVDAYNMENLDMTITAKIADRLYLDAVAKGDLHNIIKQLDALIEAYYTLLNMTKRIGAYTDLCEHYRSKAIHAAECIMEYYPKEKFALLPDEESKELVLINSRYISMLYEGCADEESKKKEWEILTQALEVEKDSFYREQVPDYDWEYHHLRTLEYFAFMLELGNQKGLNRNELVKVAEYCQELMDLWKAKPELREYVTESEIRLFLARAKYWAERCTLEEYKTELRSLYEKRDNTKYGIGEIFQNVLIPVEFMLVMKMESMTEEELFQMDAIYKNVISYAASMPNTGSLCYLLEYFSEFMSNYIEIPGQNRYMEVCLDAMAALHPPTYVHSNMVGRISKCLCRHLLNMKPELFVGVLGYSSTKEVLENREQIENYIYNGALCHDVGKIWIMDTIFVYGRNLTDEEFSLIKAHPVVGEAMLNKFDSVRLYKDLAYGHHKWADNSMGYPVRFDIRKSDVKLLVDLLACADCLDAATDSVGRSYTTKKTIDEVLTELISQSGKRYTSAIKDLLDDEKVVSDLKYLLTDGRREMYYNTFRRLLTVKTSAYN